MTAFEDAKFVAEAALAEAEARAADALVVVHNAVAKRWEAETELLTVNAVKAKAELENMDLQNRLVRIAADAAGREESDHLAGDKFHHLYTISSGIGETTVKNAIGQLTQWMRQDPGCDIEIVFNSPGGSLVEGFALFDFIKLLQANGHHVTTTALGMAASMAGILLQAGDKRTMGKQAWLMIHEASFGTAGKIGEVEDTVAWVKMVQERILNIFAERSTLSKAQLKTRWLRKDWWLSSDEALKLGFIDEIK